VIDYNSDMEQFGNYKILKKIASGGMGEVLLAFDPLCDREVALKKIRHDLKDHAVIRERFMREAKIAAQLSHPAIIPIYMIHEHEGILHYTMPFIAGQSLKEILKQTKKADQTGEPPPPLGQSIPSLIRIFLKICQAVAYSHSKGFLHRDLKPDNILVGDFGEVLIIDWGLAEPIEGEDSPLNVEVAEMSPDLTRPGKVVGTINYVAPERLLDSPSTIQTEIYSLGVMLYLLLTLELPFKRKSFADYKENHAKERLIDASQRSLSRDIPQKLSDIARKCLEKDPTKRYQKVGDLIADLECYIEGKPDWEKVASLSPLVPTDWEFQENVLLTKQIAITRSIELMQWVALMISKEAFTGNTRIESRITLGPRSSGIGILLAIPEPKERAGLEDGFSIWLGSESNPGVRLNRSNTEVAFIPDFHLTPSKSHKIVIEKVDHHLSLLVDGIPILNYTSQLPLVGSHVGLLTVDADFTSHQFDVYTGSSSLMVGCMAVPDAFFASKDFPRAREEYARIARSFKGRAEGREALFRQGLTLIEEAKQAPSETHYWESAFEVFESLQKTPSAPLEYLGKSLIEKEQGEIEEEVKYLEMGLRRFPKHALRPLLIDHIHYRLHESSQVSRNATFHFMLLALRLLPHLFNRDETALLFHNLRENLEPLPFLPRAGDDEMLISFALELAFWLKKPFIIVDIVSHKAPSEWLAKKGILALLKMNEIALAKQCLETHPQLQESFAPLMTSDSAPVNLDPHIALLLFDRHLHINTAKHLTPFIDASSTSYQTIWAYLLTGNFEGAASLLNRLESVDVLDPTSPYYPLYGCFLAATKGEEAALAHFNRPFDLRYPPLFALLGHHLRGGVFKAALPYEKEMLYRHLALYHHCLGRHKEALSFEKEALDLTPPS